MPQPPVDSPPSRLVEESFLQCHAVPALPSAPCAFQDRATALAKSPQPHPPSQGLAPSLATRQVPRIAGQSPLHPASSPCAPSPRSFVPTQQTTHSTHIAARTGPATRPRGLVCGRASCRAATASCYSPLQPLENPQSRFPQSSAWPD